MIHKKIILLTTLVLILFLAGFSQAADHEVIVVQPSDSNRMSGTVGGAFSYVDGNFVVANHDVNVDIYYSLTAGAFTYPLVIDANADAYCEGDDDYSSLKTCTYPFDTTAIADGNYFVDINVTTFTTADPSDQNSVTDSSDQNFQIDNTASALTISSPTSNQSFGYLDNSVVMTYSSSESDIAKYWVQVDSGAEVDNGTATTYTFNNLSTGAIYILKVKATDTLDNNSTQATVTILITSPPGGSNRCGDNFCNGTETAINCARDCPAICGDKACTHTESPATCLADCGVAIVCGNGTCEEGENESNCPVDCKTEDTTDEDDEETDNEQSDEEQITTPPIVVDPTCSEMNCEDNNPCTTDSCENASCFNIPKTNGTSCGIAMECNQGMCIEIPLIDVPASEDNLIGLISVSILIIIILGYVFYFKK